MARSMARYSRPSRSFSNPSAFYLEGSLGGQPVSALWDGDTLTISESLWELVELAEAVEAVYSELDGDANCLYLLVGASPGRMLVALTSLCEELTCVEYQGRSGLRKLV
jgi:hypothetical protein